MHDPRIASLLGAAARQGVTLFLDDARGLVACFDDRASPSLCRSLEVHRQALTDLLLHAGWFDCHCEHCIKLEGVH